MSGIKYREGYKYQLAETYVVQTQVKPGDHVDYDEFITLSPDGVLTIKEGYAWDGPSGPTYDSKDFMRGSLVHDALYQLMREGLLDSAWRDTADLTLRQLCIEDGMSRIRAWWVFRGVQTFGEQYAKAAADNILEAP